MTGIAEWCSRLSPMEPSTAPVRSPAAPAADDEEWGRRSHRKKCDPASDAGFVAEPRILFGDRCCAAPCPDCGEARVDPHDDGIRLAIHAHTRRRVGLSHQGRKTLAW
jgi:hypothetical protein